MPFMIEHIASYTYQMIVKLVYSIQMIVYC